MKLRLNADTSHETRSEWYGAYGAHISTESAGDVCIQAVDIDWLIECEDDDDLLRTHGGALDSRMTQSEKEELVARAQTVWKSAIDMVFMLDEAVDAYRLGDMVGVERWLDEASVFERQHGDDPATRALAKQLLEEEG